MLHYVPTTPACLPARLHAQTRICTRLNLKLLSTPFDDKNYYINIRKALTAGYFMQVCGCGCGWVWVGVGEVLSAGY